MFAFATFRFLGGKGRHRAKGQGKDAAECKCLEHLLLSLLHSAGVASDLP